MPPKLNGARSPPRPNYILDPRTPPQNWVVRWSTRKQPGRPYYFNVITNQTRWSFPSPPQPPQQPQQPPPQQPPPQQPPPFAFGGFGPPQPPPQQPFAFGGFGPPQPQPQQPFGGFGQPQPPPPQPLLTVAQIQQIFGTAGAFGGPPPPQPQPPNGGFAFGGLQHDTWEFAPNPLNLHENVRDTR